MQISDTRILTTHTGSLPRPQALVRLYMRKEPRRAGGCGTRRSRPRRAGRRRAQAARRRHRHRQQRRAAARGVLPLRPHAHERLRRRVDAPAARATSNATPPIKAAMPAIRPARAAGQQPRRRAHRDRRRALSRPRRDRHRMHGLPRHARQARQPVRRTVPHRAVARHRRGGAAQRPLPERGSLPRCARRGAARRIRSHRQPRLPAAARLPRSRDGTAHLLPGPAARRLPRLCRSRGRRPSTRRSSTFRATGSACTRAGAITRDRTTATWSCTRSCRSCAS